MLELKQIATKRFTLLSYIVWESQSREAIIVDPFADMQRMADIRKEKVSGLDGLLPKAIYQVESR